VRTLDPEIEERNYAKDALTKGSKTTICSAGRS
jgi:hypothetical protein